MKQVYSTTLLIALATCICAPVSMAAAPPAPATGRFERGNLIFDGIPAATR